MKNPNQISIEKEKTLPTSSVVGEEMLKTSKKPGWMTKWCFLLLGTLLLAQPAWGSSLKLRGYAEARYTFSGGADLGNLCENPLLAGNKKQCESFENPNILVTRIRPSALIKFNSKARIRVTGNFLTSHFKLDREINEITDLLTLQRMYLDLRLGNFDVRAGMQAFRWGPAQFWNLTIPYNPTDPTDPAAELPGLWGLNVYYSYSATGGVRFAILAAPDFKDMIQLIRWKQTFGLQDVAATFMHDGVNKRFIGAVDIKGELKVGFWLEAAVYLPYEDKGDDIKAWEPTFAVVFGIDYTFPVLENLYVMLQYYYNHAGQSDPSKYPWKSSKGLQQIASVFQTPPSNNVTGIGLSQSFIGAHYLLLSVRLSLNEDMSVALTAMANLLDPSGFAGPVFNYSFLDNFSLSVGAYYFFGPEGSEFNIGRLEIPIPDAPKDGIAVAPRFALFTWLRYNF